MREEADEEDCDLLYEKCQGYEDDPDFNNVEDVEFVSFIIFVLVFVIVIGFIYAEGFEFKDVVEVMVDVYQKSADQNPERVVAE